MILVSLLLSDDTHNLTQRHELYIFPKITMTSLNPGLLVYFPIGILHPSTNRTFLFMMSRSRELSVRLPYIMRIELVGVTSIFAESCQLEFGTRPPFEVAPHISPTKFASHAPPGRCGSGSGGEWS